MTILEAYELANKKAGIPTATMAKIDEFQAFVDSFKSDTYPVNNVLPFVSNGTTNELGIRRAVLPIRGWILMPIKSAAEDYRSLAGEREYIQPMRKLAIKFLKELYKTDIIDPEGLAKGITDTITPEPAFLNILLFGVSYTVNLPIIERAC